MIPWQDPAGETRLVAYLVAAEPPLSIGDVRRSVQARLPAHMVPALLVTVDTLPKTPTGKVDRRALPDPTPSRAERPAPLAAPRTPARTSGSVVPRPGTPRTSVATEASALRATLAAR